MSKRITSDDLRRMSELALRHQFAGSEAALNRVDRG
jgi:hypothetical protein